MAMTEYGVNSPEAVKLWSRKLAHEALKQTYMARFVGKTQDSLIQEKTDTKKDSGDSVRCTLRMLLTGDGVQGDATLEGNEESLTTYTDNIVINQLRHAARSKGKMSEQRIPFSIREESMSGLRDWWADRMDTWFFNQICGNTAVSDTRLTGNQATIAPSATRIMRADNNSTDEALSVFADDKMTLQLLDFLKEKAETATPLIRPVMVNGVKKYVVFLHPYQVTDLRTNTNTGQWLDIQKAAMQGGKVSDNPIFSGAIGEYNNMILHSSTRVTNGVHSSTGAALPNVRRAVLCGAQSAAIAFGQGHSLKQYDWVEELFDYGNQLGVQAGCIGGLKKCVYNSTDFGTIVLSTYASTTRA